MLKQNKRAQISLCSKSLRYFIADKYFINLLSYYKPITQTIRFHRKLRSAQTKTKTDFVSALGNVDKSMPLSTKLSSRETVPKVWDVRFETVTES